MKKLEKFGLIGMIIFASLFSVIGISELMQGYVGGVIFFLAGLVLLILILKENIDNNKAVEK